MCDSASWVEHAFRIVQTVALTALYVTVGVRATSASLHEKKFDHSNFFARPVRTYLPTVRSVSMNSKYSKPFNIHTRLKTARWVAATRVSKGIQEWS